MKKHIETEQCINHQNFLPQLINFKQNLQLSLSSNLLLNSYLRLLADQHLPDHQNEPSNPQKEIQTKEEVRDSVKNETKNISKNFGKAIISFIENHQTLLKKLFVDHNVSYEQYVAELKSRKKSIISIANLRGLWVEGEFPYAKLTRIISLHFLRRNSFRYVFKSRISNYKGHLKYKNRLIEVLKNPEEFTSMKILSQ